MGARYYDQQVGRFMSPDPLVPDPVNPADWNPYSYVRNSPINLFDPTGAAPEGADGEYGTSGDSFSLADFGMGALAAVGDEISGVVSFFSAVWNADETIDQATEFINYAKERIGDGGWGDFLMEIAEGMIPPGCVERGWDYCAGYVVTTLVLSAAAGGVAKLLSKADTILDATPNVGTRNRTDSDSGRSVTDCVSRGRSFSADTGVLLADGA